MANYRESAVSGTKWTRSVGGSFNNPYQGVPSIRFEEEEVVSLGDGTIIKQPAPMSNVLGASNSTATNLNDPEKSFPLLNPVDGTTIGTAKYKDVFVILHSLYMAISLERDQAIADRLAAQAAEAQALLEAQARAAAEAAAQAQAAAEAAAQAAALAEAAAQTAAVEPPAVAIEPEVGTV